MLESFRWEGFEEEVVRLVDGLSEDQVPMKAYAQTYARNIRANLEEAVFYNMSFEEATKTQMLYVLSNLEGASKETYTQLQQICEKVEVDISSAIRDIESEDE